MTKQAEPTEPAFIEDAGRVRFLGPVEVAGALIIGPIQGVASSQSEAHRDD